MLGVLFCIAGGWEWILCVVLAWHCVYDMALSYDERASEQFCISSPTTGRCLPGPSRYAVRYLPTLILHVFYVDAVTYIVKVLYA